MECRRLLTLLILALTVTGSPTAFATVGSADTRAGLFEQSDRTVLERTTTFERVNSTTVRATVAFSVPESVDSFQVSVDAGIQMSDPSPRFVSASGFERDDDGYVWDGTTAEPTAELVMTLPTDTEAIQNARFGKGSLARSNWALVPRSWTHVSSIRPRETSPTVAEDVAVEGGVIGPKHVVLGDVESYTRSVDGRNVTVIAPTDPSVETPIRPERVADALAATERELDLGGDEAEKYLYVVPSDRSRLDDGTAGFASGNESFVLSPVDNYDTYVHEYVHTRQRFVTNSSFLWFNEASATYLGYFVSLRLGAYHIDPFEQFRNLVVTSGEYHANSVLAEPDSWDSEATPYVKGGHLLAALDAKIRAETDHERSLVDVFRRVNARDGRVTHEQFRDVVVSMTDESTGEWLDRYATTSDVPTVPDDPDGFGYAQASFEPGVGPGGPGAIDVSRDDPGDVLIRLNGTDTATLSLWTDTETFSPGTGEGRVNATVTDGSGDGKVVLRFRLGNRPGAVEVTAVHEDDSVRLEDEFANGSLEDGLYVMAVRSPAIVPPFFNELGAITVSGADRTPTETSPSGTSTMAVGDATATDEATGSADAVGTPGFGVPVAAWSLIVLALFLHRRR